MSMEVYVPQPSSVSVYLLVKSTVYVILVSSSPRSWIPVRTVTECIAKHLIWTTLNEIFSIFVLHPQILDFQIVVFWPNIILS